MKSNEYIENCKRTDVQDYQMVHSRLENMDIQILHAMLGINTEAGEITDAIKKYLIYGKPLDDTNLIEEAGDLMWYISLLLRSLNISYENVWQRNIDKLKVRFPEKFTEEKALNRDLNKEREVLVEPRTGKGSLD